MRVERGRAVGLALAASVFVACATHEASAPAEDTPGRSFRVPHRCKGAQVHVHWPPSLRSRSLEMLIQKGRTPETRVPEPGQRPTGEETAAAVKNAIEHAIPELKCYPEDQYYVAVKCSEEDFCKTTMDEAQAYVLRIRAVVTSAAEVSALDCACRTYRGGGC